MEILLPSATEAKTPPDPHFENFYRGYKIPENGTPVVHHPLAQLGVEAVISNYGTGAIVTAPNGLRGLFMELLEDGWVVHLPAANKLRFRVSQIPLELAVERIDNSRKFGGPIFSRLPPELWEIIIKYAVADLKPIRLQQVDPTISYEASRFERKVLSDPSDPTGPKKDTYNYCTLDNIRRSCVYGAIEMQRLLDSLHFSKVNVFDFTDSRAWGYFGFWGIFKDFVYTLPMTQIEAMTSIVIHESAKTEKTLWDIKLTQALPNLKSLEFRLLSDELVNTLDPASPRSSRMDRQIFSLACRGLDEFKLVWRECGIFSFKKAPTGVEAHFTTGPDANAHSGGFIRNLQTLKAMKVLFKNCMNRRRIVPDYVQEVIDRQRRFVATKKAREDKERGPVFLERSPKLPKDSVISEDLRQHYRTAIGLPAEYRPRPDFEIYENLRQSFHSAVGPPTEY